MIFLIAIYFRSEQIPNKEERIIEYLESKYDQEFIVKEKIEDANEEVSLWAYSISPLNNENITFVAGQKREKHIFPFFAPIMNRVFYDDYFDAAKRYVTAEVVPDKTFFMSSDSDIADLSEAIYTFMEEVNDRLSSLRFETTKYSCSLELEINANQQTKKINFYIMDRSKIYDSLFNFYYSKNSEHER